MAEFLEQSVCDERFQELISFNAETNNLIRDVVAPVAASNSVVIGGLRHYYQTRFPSEKKRQDYVVKIQDILETRYGLTEEDWLDVCLAVVSAEDFRKLNQKEV